MNDKQEIDYDKIAVEKYKKRLAENSESLIAAKKKELLDQKYNNDPSLENINDGAYIDFDSGLSTVCLDGVFTLDELKKIIAILEENEK